MSSVYPVLRIAIGLCFIGIAAGAASTGDLTAHPVAFLDRPTQSLRSSSSPLAQPSTKNSPSTSTEAQIDQALHSQMATTDYLNAANKMKRTASPSSEVPFEKPIVPTTRTFEAATVTPIVLPAESNVLPPLVLPFRSNKPPILFISLQGDQV